MSSWQNPPVLIGERTLWLGSGSGLPKPALIRWIGHLPEMGQDWTVGLELDEALPVGGIDGTWRGRILFTCRAKHGLLVPISSIIPSSHLKHIPNISGLEERQHATEQNTEISSAKHSQPQPQSKFESVVDPPRAAVRHKRRIPTPPSSDSDEPSVPAISKNSDTEQATLRVEDREEGDSLKKRLRLFTENNGAFQRMNNNNGSAFEEVVIDSLYAQRSQQVYKHGRLRNDSSHALLSSASSPGSRRERNTSAIFSIFRWFRRENRNDDFDSEFAPSAPPSPKLVKAYSSSCGSVDTLFSTATASSFAFIHPAHYRPFGAAIPPEKCITAGPETETYRNRLRQRDRIRELDKNLTLKKKYHLFGSGTLHRSADDVNNRHLFLNKSLDSLKFNLSPGSKNSTLGRKKRKAPAPPGSPDENLKEFNLPVTLENDKENTDVNSRNETVAGHKHLNRPCHRRTVSDSAKDRKSGAFVHVRGKRKAPPPPTAIYNNSQNENITNNEILGTRSLGRKKRHAPPPPLLIKRENKEDNGSMTPGKLSPEEKQRLIDNITKLQAHADRNSLLITSPPASPTLSNKMSHTVCNDSLKLEKGVLRANKTEIQSSETKPTTPTTPTPVSPRPWYKRNMVNKEKSLDKKKDKNDTDDWMPEVAIVRGNAINNEMNTHSYSNNNNSCRLSNIFSRFEKPEEKRKSQISMLANISELDREAAEIVQREQEKERAMLAAEDAKYYTSAVNMVERNFNESPESEIIWAESKISKNAESPKKSGARELISFFNVIGNITKVSVHSAFFSKEGPSIFTKEGIDKRFSLSVDEVKTSEDNISNESVSKSTGSNKELSIVATNENFLESPGIKRRHNLTQQACRNTDHLSQASSHNASPEVLIEEVIEVDIEKSKPHALYEAKKVRKNNNNLSTNIPTIDEMSESVSSLTTSTCSTIKTSEGSVSVTPTLPTEAEPSSTIEKEIGTSITPTTSCRSLEVTTKASTTESKSMLAITDPKQPSKNYSIWSCPRCTLENPRWRVTCEACDMWRPAVRRDVIDKLTNANMGTTIAVNIVKARDSKNNSVLENSPARVESHVPLETSDVIKSTKNSTQHLSKPTIGAISNNNQSYIKKDFNLKPMTVSGLLNGSYELTRSAQEKDLSEIKVNSTTSNISYNIESITKTSSSSGNKSVGLLKEKSLEENGLQDKKITTNTSENNTSNDSGSTSGLKNDSDIEEVRKARLAFFEKSVSKEQNENTKAESHTNHSTVNKEKINALFSIASKGSLATNEEERLKVKEILKEMKNSLPKKSREQQPKASPSKVKFASENLNKNENVPEIATPSSSSTNDGAKLGAIKKYSTPTSIAMTSNTKTKQPMEKSKEQTAEVYLIKSETIIEEIKVKNNDNIKPSKVSTSVQTSGVVRKIESSKNEPPECSQNGTKSVIGKPPTPKAVRKEIIVPVTVEEHTTKGSKIETKTSKETRKMGIGVFELMRPRDFANIEATKTGTEVKPHHVYANVPRPQNEDSSSSSESSDSPEVTQLSAQLTKPKGLADFKASVLEHGAGNKMNTLAVNRLLRQLEAAIAGGQHVRAATLAKQLARHKVNCCVTRHRQSELITVDLYVEDKLSHKGPLALQVTPAMTVAQLKAKVETQLEIPVTVQRWILGKQLATDDRATLQELNVTQPHCPVFLYLVAPEGGQEKQALVNGVTENESPNTIQSPAPVADSEGAVGLTPAHPGGRGWYFNHEEDRYSYCESELTDQSSKDPSPEPKLESVPQLTQPRVQMPDDEEEEEVEEDEEEEDEEEVEEEEEQLLAGAVAAEAQIQPPNPLGTLTIGWKCETCTLVNSPTRPGCVACGAERPASYKVPDNYQVSTTEQQRLQMDKNAEQAAADEKLKNYQQLMVLENTDLIPSTESFECSVCLTECEAKEGVVLRDCLHTFCKTCLAHTVQFTEEAEVKCPFRDHNYACNSTLQEREIKALVTAEVYEQHLAKSVAQAENKIGNAFHCKTPDCPGWCIFEDNVNTFQCPVCNQANCLTCQAIHPGMNCKQYQEKAEQEAETNADARRTTEMLEEMVQRGEALPCPTCKVVLMKKWGCDWLRCSMCKTEICWVTRGPRWGPNGKGDTSAGCKCGVNGVKCHPKCNYCH